MSHTKISQPHLFAMYLSSFSMLMLAAALVYFSYELVVVAKQVPGILKLVEHTSDKIDPIVAEIGEIKEFIPAILKEVEEIRKVVKPAIDEYAKTNEQLPRILDEVAATRETLPDIIAMVDNISKTGIVVSKEIAATRKTLPGVLKTVNTVSDTGLVIAKEVEGVRGLVPDILAEVKTTRESVPGMMAEADKLIDKAREAGKEASRGAVTGIFSGILMAPIDLVGNVGEKLLDVSEGDGHDFSEEDFELIKASAQELLNYGEIDEVRQWESVDSGSSGTVELIDITEDFYDDTECREMTFFAEDADGEAVTKAVSFCKGDDGDWEIE